MILSRNLNAIWIGTEIPLRWFGSLKQLKKAFWNVASKILSLISLFCGLFCFMIYNAPWKVSEIPLWWFSSLCSLMNVLKCHQLVYIVFCYIYKVNCVSWLGSAIPTRQFRPSWNLIEVLKFRYGDSVPQ